MGVDRKKNMLTQRPSCSQCGPSEHNLNITSPKSTKQMQYSSPLLPSLNTVNNVKKMLRRKGFQPQSSAGVTSYMLPVTLSRKKSNLFS